jgi:predicted NAD-dependent protein-ADP-ribosyltransferase YbiA (DUF1768 family)
MKHVLICKFRDKTLRKKLLATGNAILAEESGSDNFWGLPANNLGKILMEIRAELKK